MRKTIESFLYCDHIPTNEGTGTCELSCCVRHCDIQEEEGLCHNQEIQCEQTTKHTDSTFISKENEVLKQFYSVKYTLNEIKELTQVLGDFIIVLNCNLQKFC